MPLDKTPWTDETVLPWGQHRGVKVGKAPVAYLLWLSEQGWVSDWPGLQSYLRSPVVKKRIAEALKSTAGQDAHPKEMQTFDDYRKDYRGF